MHFGIRKSRTCCVAGAVQHARHSTSRQARQARKDELDRHDTQLSLLSNVYKVKITVIRLLFNVSYSLIYWTIHLFNLFRLTLTNRNCVCKENKSRPIM